MRTLHAGMTMLLLAPMAGAQDAESLGPAPLTYFGSSTGRVSAIVASPTDPNRYFAAGADAGVWRTTDGGESWEPLTDHMPTLAIGALALDPTNESIVYAGSGEANFANHSRYGLGLYKSVDGGDTWAVLGADVFAGRCFSKIVIDPSNPQRLYASITRAGGFPELAAAKGHPMAEGPLGVFRSLDGGERWTHLTNGIATLSATDIAINPQNPSVLYAAIGRIFGSPSNGVYKSTDGGDSWTKLGGGLPTSDVGRISVAVSPGMPDRVVALVTQESTSNGGSAQIESIYRSDNAGASWTDLGNGISQASYGWYLSTISFRPTDPNTIIAGGLELGRSTNAGQNWSDITPPHVDLHAIAWDASGRLLVGDDGGVHRSANLGSDWESLNTNLSSVQFYAGLSTSPTDDEFVIGGAQDNGSNRRDDDTTQWTTVQGGDGGWTQIDQASPNRLFVEFQGTGNIYVSNDFGDDFNGAGAGISVNDRNCFLPPYLIDPTNSNRMLYATHRIYQSTNAGGFWSVISGDLTNGNGAIRTLAMAPSDPQVVYAATNDGNVLVSFDGGNDWEIIRTGHPGWPRVTRELVVDPTDPFVVYLAGAVFGVDQVLRSTDAGRSWDVLDGDLPDVPVNVIGVDASGAIPVLYAGTDSGLYGSADEGDHWSKIEGGMPNAAVIDLLVQPERERIVVGTQGRGAWEIKLTICIGDANGDGELDILDFIAFQMKFVAGEASADCNGDGTLSILDFICFQQEWQAGCR
jgi:photosystem II stability/assembly factor-like uncharacterized protein